MTAFEQVPVSPADATPAGVAGTATGWGADRIRIGGAILWLGVAWATHVALENEIHTLADQMHEALGISWFASIAAVLLVLLFALLLPVAAAILPVAGRRRNLAAGSWLLAAFANLWWDLGLARSFQSDLNVALSRLIPSVLFLLGWLVGRRRSGRAYGVGLPVVAVAAVWVVPDGFDWLFRQLAPSSMYPAYIRSTGWLGAPLEVAFALVPVVLGAWAAALVDPAGHRAAYPTGTVPVGGGETAGLVVPRTNPLAITSLVTSLVGLSVPAIVCGHIARSQIRRTGEAGGGLALAGLIVGYVGAGMVAIYLIVALQSLGGS